MSSTGFSSCVLHRYQVRARHGVLEGVGDDDADRLAVVVDVVVLQQRRHTHAASAARRGAFGTGLVSCAAGPALEPPLDVPAPDLPPPTPGSLSAFCGVNTASTPGAASAARVSMCFTRPLAIVLVTITACAMFGSGYSAAYRAPPVTLSRPSTRLIGSADAWRAVGFRHADISVSARTSVRLASSTLNPLSLCGRAPARAARAAAANVAPVARLAGQRALPPRANATASSPRRRAQSRAARIVPPCTSSATAAEASANA